MFIYKTAEFVPVWTAILKILAIFVHQTLTEHALLSLTLNLNFCSLQLPLLVNPFFPTSSQTLILRLLQPLFTKLAKSHISAQFFVKVFV